MLDHWEERNNFFHFYGSLWTRVLPTLVLPTLVDSGCLTTTQPFLTTTQLMFKSIFGTQQSVLNTEVSLVQRSPYFRGVLLRGIPLYTISTEVILQYSRTDDSSDECQWPLVSTHPGEVPPMPIAAPSLIIPRDSQTAGQYLVNISNTSPMEDMGVSNLRATSFIFRVLQFEDNSIGYYWQVSARTGYFF